MAASERNFRKHFRLKNVDIALVSFNLFLQRKDQERQEVMDLTTVSYFLYDYDLIINKKIC